MGLKAEILKIHQSLLDAGIDHALIGGFALAVHGINRSTGDIDLLIDDSERIHLIETLAKIDYRVHLETPEILHLLGGARLDVLLARRPLSKAMLGRAFQAELLNIKCLGPEDLIGLKIQAYCNDRRRELQDKADIQFLLNRYPALDLSTVKSYADLFGEWPVIDKLRPQP